MALLHRHERFCEEYLIDLNGTQAYLRAGYQVSVETASKNSFKLLQKPEVQLRIHQLMKERSNRTAVTSDRVLKEIARIAFSNISEVIEINKNGELQVRNLQELSEDITASISEVTQFQAGKKSRIAIRLHNKIQALQTLMQYLGMNNDFSLCIAGLQKYGLKLWRDSSSNWHVTDLSRPDNRESPITDH